MPDSIPLHPQKGLNPRLAYCPRCGEETNEIAMLGANDKIYECEGGHQHLGVPTDGICSGCGHHTTFRFLRHLEDHERLPASQPCVSCQEEIKTFEKVVAEGGVYIQCKDCGMQGVLKKENPLCAQVREKMNVPAPGPVGLELTREQCPRCPTK
jgi:hypothetical protein